METDTVVKEYQTSKEDCQNQIKGVCEGCGGQLEPIETVTNSGQPTFWVGCNHCSCFRQGIDKIYFDIARNLVEADRIPSGQHMRKCDYEDTPENLDYYYDSETANLSTNIRDIHRHIKEYLKRNNA